MLAEDRVAAALERLPQGARTAALIIIVGLLLFFALGLDSAGETAFMYATF